MAKSSPAPANGSIPDADWLGLLRPLLDDDRVTEIMVNGPRHVYAEMRGEVYLTDVTFADEAELRVLIDQVVRYVNRSVSAAAPMCDARLPDGSRVHIALPPAVVDWPTLTIRKFPREPLHVEDLAAMGSCDEVAFAFLRACVIGGVNIIVSGGTGTGKTTMLNILSTFIPSNERIITIEDTAELRLMQEHVVRMEGRPPDADGNGSMTIRSLLLNALRMRPNRIIVGECRGPEALDMLQAMNTGHQGSMTTLHANTSRDALARLETLVMMAEVELPLAAVRKQIASALNVIVQLERQRDGSRKVVQIVELEGTQGDIYNLGDIFNRVDGELRVSEIRPKIIESLQAKGIAVPPELHPLAGLDARQERKRRW